MNRTKVLKVFLVLTLMAMFAMPTQIKAEVTIIRLDIPEDQVISFPDPCTGEIVDWEGRIQIVIRSSLDSQGCLHFVWHANTKDFVGWGRDGTIYSAGAHVINDHINSGILCGGFPYVYNFRDAKIRITRGGEPNSKTYFWGHITWFGPGDVTAVVDNELSECQDNLD
jgi:hypothetical protein